MSEDDVLLLSGTPRSTPRSSGSSISPSPTISTSSCSGNAKSAVAECIANWVSYLQTLNNLCASGYRLSQCITALETWSNEPSSQGSVSLVSAWDDLAKVTNIATATVKSHMVSILQDFKTQPLTTFETDTEVKRVKEHNNYIVQESFTTLVSLHHQFSYTSCEVFSTACNQYLDPGAISQQEIRSQTPSPGGIPKTEITRSERFGSGSTQSSDHAFEQIRGPNPGYWGPLPPPGHLLSMKTPFYRGSRSPLNFPLFPTCQRRWSETAAVQSAADEGEGQVRRWSMPWEPKTDKHNARIPISKLAGPMTRANHCEREAVGSGGGNGGGGAIRRPSYGEQIAGLKQNDEQEPDSSIDGLAEAIQLLSMPKPFVKPPGQPPPFTEPQQQGLYGIWSGNAQNALPPYWSYREHDEDTPN